MGGISGFDFGGALFCFFAVERPGGLPFLSRLRLGRPLRRLDAVVEGMKLCPPVGAADNALGHLVVVGPPVEFVGVVRQGHGLPGFRVDQIDDHMDMLVGTVGMFDDDRLMVLHAEGAQGIEGGLAHMRCVRIVGLVPVERKSVNRLGQLAPGRLDAGTLFQVIGRIAQRFHFAPGAVRVVGRQIVQLHETDALGCLGVFVVQDINQRALE